MKKIFYLLGVLIFISLHSSAQQAVQWTFGAKKITGDIYEVHLKATVQRPWHIYSQYMEEGGPIPTKLAFNNNSSVILLGTAKENGEPLLHHDEVFNIDVKYYSDVVDFIQKVKLKDNKGVYISGMIEFMICNDKQCMPPSKVPFSIVIQ